MPTPEPHPTRMIALAGEVPATSEKLNISETIGALSRATHGCTSERKSIEAVAGLTAYTVTTIAKDAAVTLEYDRNFTALGIKRDGILINQGETRTYWSEELKAQAQVGKRPEEFLGLSAKKNALAHYPNHFGWQAGECLIKDGQMITIPGDPLLPRVGDVLCQTKEGWEFRTLNITAGRKSGLEGVKNGFSVPLIVKDSKPLDILDLLDQPRFRADPRNGVNFTPGGVHGDFFVPFREGPQMLIDTAAYKLLYSGETFEVSGKTKLTQNGFEVLQRTMTDKMREHIQIDFDGEITTFKVIKPLPKQSIPAYILGVNAARELVTIAVDGRQPGVSAGATFRELQEIAIKEGLVHAAFGPAGNDIANVALINGKVGYASSPAGDGKSRPVPACLIVSA